MYYEGVEVYLHAFLIPWHWMEVASFMFWPHYPWERAPGAYLIGSWVDPRAHTDMVVKRKSLLGIESWSSSL
jgi:hypothetical protein